MARNLRLEVVCVLAWIAVLSRAEVLDILDEETLQAAASRGPVFVQFFAPWCEHCKTLAPTWIQLDVYASKNLKNIKIARVDCTAPSTALVCKNHKVKGYPTLKLIFPKRSKNQKKEDGEVGRVEQVEEVCEGRSSCHRHHPGVEVEEMQYRRKRTLEALSTFAQEEMEEEVRGRVRQRRSQATGLGQEKANQGAVLHLSTKSFSQVVNGWAAGGPAVFVAFVAPWCSHCNLLKAPWQEVAEAFTGESHQQVDQQVDQQVRIAQVDCVKEKELCKAQSIDEYPTVKLYKNGEVYAYTSAQRDTASLQAFLHLHALGSAVPNPSKEDSRREQLQGYY